MELFIDSCDPQHVATWLRRGVVTGVTTNPVLLSRAAVGDRVTHLRALAALAAPWPVCVQVETVASEQAIVDGGRRLAALGPNVVVKVPAVSPAGAPQLDAVHRLAGDGVAVNVTACLTAAQAMLAAAAGAAYVSLLCGRIADDGRDPVATLLAARAWASTAPRPVRVVVGSIRSVDDLVLAVHGQPDIVTVPPRVLEAAADHHVSRTTAAEFLLATESA
jgi:transaldolase